MSGSFHRVAAAIAATLALGAVSALVLAAPSAAAPKPQRATELTLTYNTSGQNFRGQVRSANVCEAARKVILFEDPEDGAPQRVDVTSSANAGGRYAFGMSWPNISSAYFTKSPRTKAGGVVCKAGKSPRYTLAG